MLNLQVVCFIELSEAGVLFVFLKMDKTEYPAVIKFFVKEGLTPNEIYSKFVKVYGDSSPSFSTIKDWAAEYNIARIRTLCEISYVAFVTTALNFDLQSNRKSWQVDCLFLNFMFLLGYYLV
jgi:hypothetical protein